jgi:RNA polymerase sigma factor (sigma-70 family)
MNRKAASGGNLAVLERLFVLGTVSGLSEGQLVARFVRERDESAFEVILARHGPTVLGVCRRLLDDSQDVEDAFQATFLVLVKKAQSLHDRERLGSWLYGVALCVARRLRRDRSRRRSRERPAPVDLTLAHDGRTDDRELHAMLDAEVERLPEKFRSPIILCYFEGMTHDQAAQRLDCPVGTVRSRMAKARELLRSRLSRRGVEHAHALLLILERPEWTPAVSPSLTARTVAAAMRIAAGQSASAGAVSLSAATLTQGVLRTMTLTKMITCGAILMIFGAAGGGAQLAARQLGSDGAGKPAPEHSQKVPLDAAIKSVEEARALVNEYADRLARSEAELKAMRMELEHLREVLSPSSTSGAGKRRGSADERPNLAPPGGSAPTAANGVPAPKTPTDPSILETFDAIRRVEKPTSADTAPAGGTGAERRWLRNAIAGGRGDREMTSTEEELKVLKQELENIRAVLRPFALGGGGMPKEEIEERLKPVAPGGNRRR